MKSCRFIYAVSWLLSLVAISFYGGVVSYGFFFGLTLVSVISVVYLIFVYFRFKIFQELGSRNVVCRQPVDYFFVLQNDDKFTFAGVSVTLFSDLSYVEEMPDNKEYELLPGESFRYETRLVCKYRGEYEVGIREIVVTDFLGLFRFRYKMPGTIKALVKPRVVKVDELKSISDISTLVQREALNMSSEYDVITRDYMPGDDLRRVHWKAAAREQKLKIRNKIGEEKQGVAIFVDTERYHKDNKIYLPAENTVLEIALALGFFFAEKNISASAYYSQRSIQKVRLEGVRSFEQFYRSMSGVIFDEEEKSIDKIAGLTIGNILSESHVVFFVLQKMDDTILELTEPFLKRNILVVIYVVTNDNIEAYIRQSNLQRRIIAVPVDAEPEEVL